jgi:hypothetical protein
MEPEHISKPIRRVMDILEVVYTGNDYDGAIERELRRLGIRADQVKTIIAIPAEMANNIDDKQIPLFF